MKCSSNDGSASDDDDFALESDDDFALENDDDTKGANEEEVQHQDAEMAAAIPASMVTAASHEDVMFFITNLCVYQGRAFLFGVMADGRTVGVHATKLPFTMYIEKTGINAGCWDEANARKWMESRVKSLLKHTSTRLRPSVKVVERHKLCGYSTSSSWMVQALYDSPFEMRKDADNLRVRKIREFEVYHDRLDPNLVLTASTGLRCFTWVTCTRASVSRGLTRCDVEMVCSIDRIVATYDESDPRNLPPKLPLASYDLETDGLDSKEHEIRMIGVSCAARHFLLTRHPLATSPSPMGYCVVECDSEADMIRKFVDLISELRVVFLTGWNVFRFDTPFLFNRAKLLGCFKDVEKLSWLKGKALRPVMKQMSSNAFGKNEVFSDDLEGLIMIDGYILARKSLKMPSYSLKAFGEWIGDAKGDVSYAEMVEAFTTKDPGKMRLVADYCVQDARLVPKILARMEEPEKLMAITRLSGVPPVYAIKRGQSILTFGLVLGEAFSRRLVVNPPSHKAEESTGYQGATVIEPMRGYHKDPVAVLDFESLYPSIMRAYNICVSTYIGTFSSIPEGYAFPRHTVVSLAEDQHAVFVREGKEGVFPSILKDLLTRRKAVKKQMQGLPVDSIEYAQANAKQLSLKIACNSMYGYLGASTSQIYEKSLAASVTSLGRQSLFKVKSIIQEMSAAGTIPHAKVVYGDSVTGDTPLLVRINGRLRIRTIKELHGGNWKRFHGTKEAIVPRAKMEVWSETGFTPIKRVIRHRTRKMLYRVVTPNGIVDCTEDHGLLTESAAKVSPKALVEGESRLLLWDDATWNAMLKETQPVRAMGTEEAFEMGIRDAEVTHDLLCAPLETVQAYWEGLGDVGTKFMTKAKAAGLYLLARRLGLSYRFVCFDKGSNRVALFPRSGHRIEGLVEHVWTMSPRPTGYVYDLETESHHFGVGPGNMVVHNTDSVLLSFPGLSPSEAHKQSQFLEGQLTAAFPPPMRMEYENLFETYLLENKKRYAGKVWAEGGGPGKIVVKGLATQRRDYPKIVQEGIKGCLDILLEGGDNAPDTALAFLEETLQKIATNAVRLEDLSITKELNKASASYKTPPPHLVVAERMKKRMPNPPKPGDRITYVVLLGKGIISNRVEDYDHVREHMPHAKLDLGYYADLLCSQCKNMMHLAGRKNSFDLVAQKLVTAASLHAEGQSKLNKYFQAQQQPPAAPPVKRERKEETKEQPPARKQATLNMWIVR